MYQTTKLARKLVLAVACASLIGCVPVKENVKEELPTLIKGPEVAPKRTITNFSQGQSDRDARTGLTTLGHEMRVANCPS